MTSSLQASESGRPGTPVRRRLRGGAATYAVELHVEAAGIAHRLTLGVAAPQRGRGGLAVGTGQAHSAGGGLQQRRQTFGVQAEGRRCCFCFSVTGSAEGLAGPEWVAGSAVRALKENLRAAEALFLPSPKPLGAGMRTKTSAAGGVEWTLVLTGISGISIIHQTEDPGGRRAFLKRRINGDFGWGKGAGGRTVFKCLQRLDGP